MERLAIYLVTRLRPRVGWPVAMLLVAAAWSPALAARDSAFALPSALIGWAGVVGALYGLRLGRPPMPRARGAASGSANPALRPTLYALRFAPAVLLGAVFVALVGRALPPPGLIWGDLAATAEALGRRWRGELDVPLPAPLALRFLAAAIPRLLGELRAAPGAGEVGATLLVATMAMLSTWAGALCLGWATGVGRPTLGWGLPLLVALAATTIMGGAGGAPLVLGMALLLALAVVTGQSAREGDWERAGAAYSPELRWDVFGWGTLGGGFVLALALALPTSLPGSFGALLWGDAELPSGIAVIDREVRGAGAQPTAQVGLSQLPVVQLGVSLAQGPPETMALRVRAGGPLSPSPWPRYWRARVLTRYDGRGWWADARVGAFGPPFDPANLPTGVVVQQIEDLRARQGVLLALPNVIGLDVAAQAERLPDGALAALTASPPGGRYRAFSLPQEQATPLDGAAVPPPDLSATLAVPPGLPPRVAELARTVAGGAGPPMAQALALEAYLRALPYSYTVRPLARGGDAVDQFLFEMREGYCTYYASAMAIMARSLGIPARVATGYATGTYEAATGAYAVREADAHAWPELLIEGRWVPFEPTPIRPLPARAGAPPQAAPTAAPVAAPAPTTWWSWGSLARNGALVGLALALAAGAWVATRRRSAGPLVVAQRQIERLGAAAGVAWPPGATLHEYARLLERRAGGASPALRELVALVEGARYGRRPIGAAEERRLREARRAVARWLRGRGRNLR